MPKNLIRPQVSYFLVTSWTPFTNVSFCKWKHSINTVTFHWTIQKEYSNFFSFYHFCKRCHVRFHINWFPYKLHIWCCILTHIFFWLNTENNADPYIIKPPSLSSTRKRDNEPEGTLFSWFQPILFLPHQSNVMDHSWPLAMGHI